MKIFNKTILVLMAVMSISLTSCKKDDDGGSGGNAGSGTVVAKVDGTNFKSLDIASIASETNTGGTTMISIQGSDSSGKAIRLMISGFEGTGSYNIGGGANVFTNAVYTETDISNPQNSQAWQAPFDENVAGTVQISEKTDTSIKGTFEFEGKNVNGDLSIKKITEGSFNLNFK